MATDRITDRSWAWYPGATFGVADLHFSTPAVGLSGHDRHGATNLAKRARIGRECEKCRAMEVHDHFDAWDTWIADLKQHPRRYRGKRIVFSWFGDFGDKKRRDGKIINHLQYMLYYGARYKVTWLILTQNLGRFVGPKSVFKHDTLRGMIELLGLNPEWPECLQIGLPMQSGEPWYLPTKVLLRVPASMKRFAVYTFTTERRRRRNLRCLDVFKPDWVYLQWSQELKMRPRFDVGKIEKVADWLHERGAAILYSPSCVRGREDATVNERLRWPDWPKKNEGVVLP